MGGGGGGGGCTFLDRRAAGFPAVWPRSVIRNTPMGRPSVFPPPSHRPHHSIAAALQQVHKNGRRQQDRWRVRRQQNPRRLRRQQDRRWLRRQQDRWRVRRQPKAAQGGGRAGLREGGVYRDWVQAEPRVSGMCQEVRIYFIQFSAFQTLTEFFVNC